jgi:hypothetical protein
LIQAGRVAFGFGSLKDEDDVLVTIHPASAGIKSLPDFGAPTVEVPAVDESNPELAPAESKPKRGRPAKTPSAPPTAPVETPEATEGANVAWTTPETTLTPLERTMQSAGATAEQVLGFYNTEILTQDAPPATALVEIPANIQQALIKQLAADGEVAQKIKGA